MKRANLAVCEAKAKLEMAEIALASAKRQLTEWCANPCTRQEYIDAESVQGEQIAREIEAEERNGNTHSIPRGWTLSGGQLFNQFGNVVN